MFKVLVGFRRESRDDITGNEGIFLDAPEAIRRLMDHAGRVGPAHEREYPVASGLYGKMKVRANPLVRENRREAFIHPLRIETGNPYLNTRCFPENTIEQIGKIPAVRFVLGQIYPGKDDFVPSRFFNGTNTGDNLVRGEGNRGAAGKANTAIRAFVVAAVLNFDRGT